jgi:hypothetical protein
MARRPNPDPQRIAHLSSFVAEQTTETTEPKAGRAKRDLTGEQSQICFKIEKERHKAIRVYCVQNDLEIGELMDRLIKDHLKL